MSLLCCKSGLPNYGRGLCTVQMGEIVGVISVPTYNSDNVRNFINLSLPFGQTQIDALLTADPETRTQWSPFPRMYAVTLPIADTVFDEATDGTKSFVREGIWSLNSEIRDKDAVAAILKKLKSLRCKDYSFYLVTRDNQLVGVTPGGGNKLYPLELNSGSTDPKMMFRDAQATNKIMFNVDFDNLIKQQDLYILQGEDLTTYVDFLRLQKLTDVQMYYANLTATTIKVGVKTDFTQGLQPNNDVTGLEIGDFIFTNKTTDTVIVPSAIEEDPLVDGLYELTFTAQTAGDVGQVSMDTATNFYIGETQEFEFV